MRNLLLSFFAALSLASVSRAAPAPETNSAAAELQSLVAKIQSKLHEGKSAEADLTNEVKEFDVLLAEHKGDTNDDVANILFMKAKLYEEVFHDAKGSAQLLAQLKQGFPDSSPVQEVQRHEEAQKLQVGLLPGSVFPDFKEKDLAGAPLSPANYRGKVLLIDFWATWCGPCVGELPNVLKIYEKHHAQGFEIIGVSLDKNQEKLANFIKEKNVPWPQYFDGKGWENKLASKYGIQSIPSTFLVDGAGKIIARDLRGADLDEAVAKALAKGLAKN
jgi:thiol-disulfide isomerase/thioredoxin